MYTLIPTITIHHCDRFVNTGWCITSICIQYIYIYIYISSKYIYISSKYINKTNDTHQFYK